MGIILALPGRPARTVFATAGPSTLVVLGPAAAGEYFAARSLNVGWDCDNIPNMLWHPASEADIKEIIARDLAECSAELVS